MQIVEKIYMPMVVMMVDQSIPMKLEFEIHEDEFEAMRINFGYETKKQFF